MSSEREDCIKNYKKNVDDQNPTVMNSYVLFTVFLICLASLSSKADAFCGKLLVLPVF